LRPSSKLGGMTTIRCSALLFDLDGVLIDSTPAVARVWHRWAQEHGFDPAEVVRRAHGRPSLSTIREFLPDADHEVEDREVERRELEDTEGVIQLPGTQQLLGSLPSDRWTIVTSCTRTLAEVRLRKAGLPIPKNMVTASDVENGKPHPEPYQKAATILGYAAFDCVVAEDVPSGIRAGKTAGARVVAFTTTMDRRQLENAGADWVVRNCADISAARDGDALVLTIDEDGIRTSL
jgi:mannitol-1-/sugar-/sorbitol-6-phosphatase